MLTIAAVYKPGAGFTDEYVYRLRDAVDKNLSLPHKFVCYTDQKLDVETRPLIPGLKGWYNKISLWKIPSEGDMLYFDLDTIITGDITDIASAGQFTLLNDLGRRLTEWRLQSGMMYLTPEARKTLSNAPMNFHMGGDGQWIHSVIGENCARFQDLFPGQVCSYKYHVCREWKGNIPSNVRVVCFHGIPRPHQVGWDPRTVWTKDFKVINVTGEDLGMTIPKKEMRWEAVLSRLPEGPVLGAEIGVNTGTMSAKLLERRDLTLYMVDSYSAGHQGHLIPGREFKQSMYESTMNAARKATAFAGKRARMVRAESLQAAAVVPDETFDFVFIDADHTYEGCRADIVAWLPKVKKGGILCGHDYDWEPDRNSQQFPGVKKAVDELLTGISFGGDGTWFWTRT